MSKKKKWLMIGLVLVLAVIIVIVGIIIGSMNQEVHAALTPHYKYNDCIYWSAGLDAVTELPEGFQEAGSIIGAGASDAPDELKNGESSFGKIGHKIYANTTNPYSTFLFDEVKQVYKLYVSQELRYTYVMIGGKLYYNKSGSMNESFDQPWEHGECVYMGTVQEVIEYEIPDKDFQSNMARAENGGIYMSETEDVVYVIRKDHGDTNTYVKMLPVDEIE